MSGKKPKIEACFAKERVSAWNASIESVGVVGSGDEDILDRGSLHQKGGHKWTPLKVVISSCEVRMILRSS